ncbi:MAG: HEAT repeat domain-containing protein, partial [Verrucomicrobia bacterium]|nr:HEAT repeat domain-containing protein [Verrucomicrobiota bacterium]
MNVPMELLDAKAEAWWTCVFHAAWQGALVGGVLVMVIHLGRRWPGPLRYWLLTLALLKFAFPPLLPVPTGVFSAVGPRPIMRERALEPVARFSPVELDALEKTPRWTAEPMPSFADVERQTVASSPRNSISSPALQSAPPLHWKTWLMLAHAAGGLAFLSWLVWQVSRLSRVARRAYGLNQGELYEQFSLLSEQFALRRRPRLMVSAQIHTPIAFGLLRPTVMLPAAVVEKLPLSEVRVILAHELAHYQRGDLWVNWLQLLLLAVWWFHPVVWLLNRALRQVREDCCDDFLLAQGLTSNEAYCDVLVRAAAELSGKVPIGATLGFAEQMHPLGRRVARIMDRTIRRCHRVPALGVLALLALGGLLLPGLKSQETRSIGKETGPRAVPARSASSSPTAQDNLEAATTTEPLRTGTIRGPEESKESKSAAELFKQLDMFQSRLKRSHASLLDEFVHLQPSVVPFLIQQLEDQNQPVEARRKAAWLLSEMGAAARPALPTLLKALEDDDAQVAQEAANVLGAIGPEAKTAIP